MGYYNSARDSMLLWQCSQYVSSGPDSRGYYRADRVEAMVEAPTAYAAAEKFGAEYLDGVELLGSLRPESSYTDSETERFYVVFSGQYDGHGLRVWIQTEA